MMIGFISGVGRTGELESARSMKYQNDSKNITRNKFEVLKSSNSCIYNSLLIMMSESYQLLKYTSFVVLTNRCK